MDHERRNDVLFEAVFRQAVIENHNQELEEIPTEKELAKSYAYSERHKERMKKLFAREEKRERLARIFIASRKVAAAIFIVGGILFAALMTVPTVQGAVREAFMEWYGKFTKFVPHQNEDTVIKEWLPSYIPDGFVIQDTFNVIDSTSIRYRKPDGQVIDFIYALVGNSSLSVNNEDVEYSQVDRNGVIYHVFSSNAVDTNNSVIWELDGYLFELRGLSPVDELLSIAYSVE